MATNVSILLKEEFIDSLTEPTFADFLRKLNGKEFLLGMSQKEQKLIGEFQMNMDALNQMLDKRYQMLVLKLREE